MSSLYYYRARISSPGLIWHDSSFELVSVITTGRTFLPRRRNEGKSISTGWLLRGAHQKPSSFRSLCVFLLALRLVPFLLVQRARIYTVVTTFYNIDNNLSRGCWIISAFWLKNTHIYAIDRWSNLYFGNNSPSPILRIWWVILVLLKNRNFWTRVEVEWTKIWVVIRYVIWIYTFI
jgi:hypothetical protein